MHQRSIELDPLEVSKLIIGSCGVGGTRRHRMRHTLFCTVLYHEQLRRGLQSDQALRSLPCMMRLACRHDVTHAFCDPRGKWYGIRTSVLTNSPRVAGRVQRACCWDDLHRIFARESASKLVTLTVGEIVSENFFVDHFLTSACLLRNDRHI